MSDGRDDREAMNALESRRSLGSHLALVMFGLSIGVLLMTLQLWLLTLAFDLYSSGNRTQTVVIACISGLVFAGGVLMLRLLDRGRPREPGR
jgi:hypothetical protein